MVKEVVAALEESLSAEYSSCRGYDVVAGQRTATPASATPRVPVQERRSDNNRLGNLMDKMGAKDGQGAARKARIAGGHD